MAVSAQKSRSVVVTLARQDIKASDFVAHRADLLTIHRLNDLSLGEICSASKLVGFGHVPVLEDVQGLTIDQWDCLLGLGLSCIHGESREGCGERKDDARIHAFVDWLVAEAADTLAQVDERLARPQLRPLKEDA
mgnify:CR=1 FL=1